MKALAAFAAAMIAACGGTPENATHVAPPPKPAEPHHLSIKVDAANAFDATGDAFAQFDPDQGMLAVFVFAPSTTPRPSCATLAMASLNLESGGFAAIRLRGYDKKSVGTFPITGGGFIQGAAGSHETRMASSGPENSSLIITTFDSSQLIGEATSGPEAEMQIHGAFTATVCPDGALGAAGQPPATSPMVESTSADALDAGVVDAAPPAKPKKKRRKKHGH